MSALIWCPFPDRQTARSVSQTLLDEKLIACANILGGVESLFIWQGAEQSADEVGTLFKTDGELVRRTIERIESLHPYETPAILGWRCEVTSAATEKWLAELRGEKG